MKRKGFTLVELVAVIAIIAILMLIAVPRFSEMTKNARMKTVEANHRILIAALHSFEAKYGIPYHPTTTPTGFPTGAPTSGPASLRNLFEFIDIDDFEAKDKSATPTGTGKGMGGILYTIDGTTYTLNTDYNADGSTPSTVGGGVNLNLSHKYN